MIPEKVTWVRFPARINTVYSKLPPITDLFLKILNQTGICQVFRCSCRISDQKIFSAMLHQNIVHQNKFFNFSANFLHFLCCFGHYNNNFIFGETCSCKLLIVNSQIKIFPIMFSSIAFNGVLTLPQQK